jgi:hypothetical protein
VKKNDGITTFLMILGLLAVVIFGALLGLKVLEVASFTTVIKIEPYINNDGD